MTLGFSLIPRPHPAFCRLQNLGFIDFWHVTDGVPYDEVSLERLVTVHTSLTVIIIFLACCGIILTAACLIFNFVFRGRQ